LLFSLAASQTLATDDVTDAERMYLDIRHSDDQLTKLLGERWYGLVKLQEWTDSTGQFHTEAKYIEHDPDMKWVKLLAVKGSGEGRVTKELTIPVEKLDERCQSRVRQIDHLKSKVEAAVAAATKTADATEQQQDVAPDGDRRRDHEDSMADTSEDGGKTNRRSHPRQPVSPPESGSSVDPPRLPDHDPWRTSYEAFRGNILRTPEGVLANRESWEGMTTLQSLAPREPSRGESDSRSEGGTAKPQKFQPVEALSDVGEFVWEATIAGKPGRGVPWADVFQLPPMIEPFEIEFRLDRELGAGNWQRFKVGDQVRFIGRFIGFKGPDVWVAAIRFPEEQPAQATAQGPPQPGQE
jgi:hypothetical protein